MDYDFVLTGQMAILFHADDVSEADKLTVWRKAAANKSVSVPGDDRSPPWTWQSYLYHDGTHVSIPQENIMACLGRAGAQVPGKGRSTFKAASQSGLRIASEHCEFRMASGDQVKISDLQAIALLSFAEQAEAVQRLGFHLLVKRAAVGARKHIRVRARFKAGWTVSGSIIVTEPTITQEVLAELFSIGGQQVGLLDWRPGSPKKPGPFGTFKATVRAIQAARKRA